MAGYGKGSKKKKGMRHSSGGRKTRGGNSQTGTFTGAAKKRMKNLSTKKASKIFG